MEIRKHEKVNNYTVELEIAVGKEEFESAIQKAYHANVGKISVPGFRRGKAPRKMIEQMYGASVFYEDAVNNSYPAAYEAAIDQLELNPVAPADLDITDLSADGYTFKAIVTVRPDITVEGYRDIRVEKPAVEVTDEDVAQELDRLADRNSRTETVERAAETGDTANIDYTGYVDGEAFGGGEGKSFNLKLGSGTFIPGFEDQIVGHSAGEEFDVVVTFPEDYQADDLKGKEATFKTKLNDVQVTIKPELDDEFAKDVSEYDTLDELKAGTRADLLKTRENAAEQSYENDVLGKLAELVADEIPEAMVKNAIDGMVEEFAYRMSMQGIDLKMYLQYTGTTEEDMRANFKPQAESQVKISLALSSVAKQEDFQTTDEEVAAGYEKLVTPQMTLEKIKEMLPEDNMRRDLITEKTINFLKETASQPSEEKTEEKAEEVSE